MLGHISTFWYFWDKIDFFSEFGPNLENKKKSFARFMSAHGVGVY